MNKTPNKKEEWIKEFDKRFVIKVGTEKISVVAYWSNPDLDIPDGENQGSYMAKTIKDFISQLLQSQKEDVPFKEHLKVLEESKQMSYNQGWVHAQKSFQSQKDNLVKKSKASLENHICRFNDGECVCDCYKEALEEILSLIQEL